MITVASVIHEAGLELFDADSHLVMAEGAAPENAVKIKQVALECLRTARRKLERATIALEKELYEVPGGTGPS